MYKKIMIIQRSFSADAPSPVTRLMTGSVVRGGLCGLVCTANRAGRGVLVPVVGRHVVVGADVAAAETEVVVAQGAVGVVEISEVGDDVVIIADLHNNNALVLRFL